MSDKPRSESEPVSEPKIIVDDDWKSRVQAEKEASDRPQQEPPARPAAATDRAASDRAASDRAASRKPPPDQESPPPPASLPPASFSILVTTLATQALAALGQFPLAEGKQPVVMIDHAKHFIDTLAVLEEKTKGNLTDDEASMLESILHELRMAFVAVSARK